MRNFLFKLFGFALLGASVGGGWVWMDYRAFTEAPLHIPQDGWIYEVVPGATVKSVAADLRALRVLDHPRYLRWLARFKGYAGKLKIGEYQFDAGITPQEFLEKLVSGKVVQHSLTIVEGWTFRQMLDAVSAHAKITRTLDDLDDAEIMVRLGVVDRHSEGMFLPDTYQFPKGTTDLEFLRRALSAMQQYLDAAWANRAPNLPYQTPYEALIMASIVEKETGAPYERPAIAGVFVRRLQKNMRLQTDPTVIYGLGARYDGNIRKSDLGADSPYNTYRIKGLPPTPVALPGKDAIDAALHPEGGKALYFVARGDGSHEFADTLEQHNRNVLRYQVKPSRQEASKK
jgi:UPF0755 protein